MIYDSILGTIGRTPVVRLQRLAPAGTTIFAKCEFLNPSGSVGDRKKCQENIPHRTVAKSPGHTPNRKEERMTAGKNVT